MPVPPERIRDPFGLRVPGFGLGRDPERTPMRWRPEPGGGFATGEPWLPIERDVATLNLASQRSEAGSILPLYRALLALRHAEPALQGARHASLRGTPQVLAFRRGEAGQRPLLVALNLSNRAEALPLPQTGRVLLSTHPGRQAEALSGDLHLCLDEGAIGPHRMIGARLRIPGRPQARKLRLPEPRSPFAVPGSFLTAGTGTRTEGQKGIRLLPLAFLDLPFPLPCRIPAGWFASFPCQASGDQLPLPSCRRPAS